MHDQVERFLAQERLITFTSLFFAALATIVAIAGLHATLAENIARRTREIGIRIAVGATPAMVRRLVLSEAGRTLGIGVCLGVPAAVSAGQASQALLSGTPLNSQLLLVITVFAICGAAVLAAAWLAQRAATTPVATALRSD